jgi:spore coat polysaccharide biosynthesis predicted glycosyltransferase SpsG
MNRDPILFRVDGTTRSGWEHLARCLTFAAALQRRRRPTYFLSQLEPASLGLSIKRTGNSWLEADEPVAGGGDLAETVQEIRRLRPAAIVVDSPDATEAYLAELAGTGTLVMSMDHLAAVRFPSHIVVNPMLSPGREAYEHHPVTQLLLGPRYAMVRPEIRRIRPGRAQEPPALTETQTRRQGDKETETRRQGDKEKGRQGEGETEEPSAAPPRRKFVAPGRESFRALIALGEDDPNHQAEALIRTLLNIPRVGRVDVLIRSHHPEHANLQALAEAHADRLELASEMTEIAARIVRAHFAVTSGCGWSLELACVGVPQLVIVQSEAHWPTAQRLEEEGCATCLGWHASVSPATIRQAVQNLLGDPLERQAMSRCARKLIDGRGADRLVTALEVLLHPSRLVDFAEAA